MKQILKVPHLWIILAIMVFGAVAYYADQIPAIQDIVAQAPFNLARYSTYRILSIIPVAYAALIFRFRGGVIAAVIVGLGLLPRALFISLEKPEALIETFAFFLIGLLVSWLIDRRWQALHRLEITQQELIDSLQTVKQQQQQLGLSEERYRGLFENAGEAILACSTDGKIKSANRASEVLTGYSLDMLTSINIYELFSEDSLEVVKGFFSEKFGREAVEETEELRLVKKDGVEAFVRLKVSPLLSGDEVVGLQVMALDVTEERHLRQSMEYYITQITRAQEDERLRISRELHDDTAQVLADLSRGLGSLIAKENKLPKSIVERLQQLHGATDSALEEVRRFSQDLRPSILDDLGLVPALKWLTADLEKQSEITTKLSITGNQHRLPSEEELVVFRIAQETISNVRRHSQASVVEMAVDFGNDALTLIISDNGQGFSMPQRASDLVPSGKLGIIGMRERARLVGGTLIVQSEIGVGTTVTLRVPA